MRGRLLTSLAVVAILGVGWLLGSVFKGFGATPVDLSWPTAPSPTPRPWAPSVVPSALPSPPPPAPVSRPSLILGDLTFEPLPAGVALLGSPESEPGHQSDEQQRHVFFAAPSWISTTEITQQQYERRTRQNPSFERHPDHPVTNVTWDEATAFANGLEQEFSMYRFRLPTEDEWEYACRRENLLPFGVPRDRESELAHALDVAAKGDRDYLVRFCRKFARFEASGTLPVASLWPNCGGLHDMHGNVWEWVSPSSFGETAGANEEQPIRGGAFSSQEVWGVRAAIRSLERRDARKPSIGFRVLASPR